MMMMAVMYLILILFFQVKPKTLNPVFEQSFNFKHITYAQLTSSYLHLKVYDYDRFSGHDMLGETKVPIIDIDLTMPVDEWRILQPEFKMETKGVSSVYYFYLHYIKSLVLEENGN